MIITLVLALVVISPDFSGKGIAISAVKPDSPASSVGISSPPDNVMPRSKEVIIKINDIDIKNLVDYGYALAGISLNKTVRITTDKKAYQPFLRTSDDIGIEVVKKSNSNMIKGLELEGGIRVLLQPEGDVSSTDLENAKDSIAYRLNVYGLSDVKVKTANDLLGNRFIIVEIAGATKEEVKELVAKQGKFEAKIGDEVVFIGGEKDITFVCRNDGTCSGIRACSPTGNQYYCRFEFVINLSPKAAKKHAEVTSELTINLSESGDEVLSKPLDLYLDDKLVDSLQIAADLRGSETTAIAISGPGFGLDENEAVKSAVKNMNKLQTVLITGSLPFKLNIVKIDIVSPTLGTAFVKNALLTGMLVAITVAGIIYVRYRRLKIAGPMLIIMFCEIFLTLGVATLIRYNLDLAGIAGIIAVIGTGVDDQIIITDEVLKGGMGYYSWKEKIKRAFFIVFTAYAITAAAMLPLLKAGAGLLTGFALTTLIGITIGVFITRPAFASIIESLLKEE